MPQWMEKFVEVKPIVVTATKRLFNLDKEYHPGQGDLIVFYNGGYAVPGIDYIEVSPWSIEFTFDLEPTETLVLHYQRW